MSIAPSRPPARWAPRAGRRRRGRNRPTSRHRAVPRCTRSSSPAGTCTAPHGSRSASSRWWSRSPCSALQVADLVDVAAAGLVQRTDRPAGRIRPDQRQQVVGRDTAARHAAPGVGSPGPTGRSSEPPSATISPMTSAPTRATTPLTRTHGDHRRLGGSPCGGRPCGGRPCGGRGLRRPAARHCRRLELAGPRGAVPPALPRRAAGVGVPARRRTVALGRLRHRVLPTARRSRLPASGRARTVARGQRRARSRPSVPVSDPAGCGSWSPVDPGGCWILEFGRPGGCGILEFGRPRWLRDPGVRSTPVVAGSPK